MHMTNHIFSCVYEIYKITRFFKTLAMDEEKEVDESAIVVSAVILSKKIARNVNAGAHG